MDRIRNIVFFGLLCFHQVLGDGALYLQLKEFDNPGGLGSNGHCCDGKFGVCQNNGCDHMFALCLDEVGGTSGMEECLYGKRLSDKLKNEDHNVFGTDINGLANPMQFSIRGDLPSRVLLKVIIKDKDTGNFWTGSNDHVDFLSTIATVSTTEAGVDLQTASTRTTLTFLLWQECDSDWYGIHCGVYCPPPTASSRYYCDQTTGLKRCHEGWEGTTCSVKVTTRAPPATQPTTTTSTPASTTTTTTAAPPTSTTTAAAPTTTTTTTAAPTTTTTTTPEPTPVKWIERDLRTHKDVKASLGWDTQLPA